MNINSYWRNKIVLPNVNKNSSARNKIVLGSMNKTSSRRNNIVLVTMIFVTFPPSYGDRGKE